MRTLVNSACRVDQNLLDPVPPQHATIQQQLSTCLDQTNVQINIIWARLFSAVPTRLRAEKINLQKVKRSSRTEEEPGDVSCLCWIINLPPSIPVH